MSTSSRTLAGQLELTRNRPSGFDYMRLILALCVIIWHVPLICYGKENQSGFWYDLFNPIGMFIVPMFFSLSGFLVAGSFERNRSLVTFMGLRVFRIVPALSVEVFISALLLGPLLTTLALSDYFAHPLFHAYFFNIIGHIQYYLPGVFEQNPFGQVNGQLWTVPYELVCYIVLAGFAVLGIYHRAYWLILALALCYGLQVLNTIFRAREDLGGATGSTVVVSFIAGLLFYRYRERVLWSFKWFVPALLVSVVLLTIPNGMRFAALPIAYVTVYLGLFNPVRQRVLLSGDYSYGIYLYGFPVQQAFVALSPTFQLWYWHLLAVIPTVILLAVFSWWVIEKPVMERRGVLTRLEGWYMTHPWVQGSRFLQFCAAMRVMGRSAVPAASH